MKSLSLFLNVFVLGAVFFCDFYFGGNSNLMRQFTSRHFSSTIGQVTDSRVTRQPGIRGGTAYGVYIAYHYEVGGQPFECARFRYDLFFLNAQDTVANHPIGSKTQVFYNPQKPEEALLSAGLNANDLIILLFFILCNMGAFRFWVWLEDCRRSKFIAGGVKIERHGLRTKVRLPRFSPIVMFIYIVSVLSFATMLALVFFSSRLLLSFEMLQAILYAIFCAGIAAYLWQGQKIHSGNQDLIIDEGSHTISLPKTFGRKKLLTIAFSDVDAIKVEPIEHRSSRGSSYSYAPTLRLKGEQSGNFRLANWYYQHKAEAFTAWLREQLGMPSQPSWYSMPTNRKR